MSCRVVIGCALLALGVHAALPLPRGECTGDATDAECGSCTSDARWTGSCEGGVVQCHIDSDGNVRAGRVFETRLLEQNCDCGPAVDCIPCTIRFASQFALQQPLACAFDGNESVWQCPTGHYQEGSYVEDCGPSSCMLDLESEFNVYNATRCVNGSFACDYDDDGMPLDGCIPAPPAVLPPVAAPKVPAPPACGVPCDHGACRSGSASKRDTCWCLPGYVGASCGLRHCAHDFASFCGGHGSCNASSGVCVCRDGRQGDRCDVLLEAEVLTHEGACAWSSETAAATLSGCYAELRNETRVAWVAGRCVVVDDDWERDSDTGCLLLGLEAWWAVNGTEVVETASPPAPSSPSPQPVATPVPEGTGPGTAAPAVDTAVPVIKQPQDNITDSPSPGNETGEGTPLPDVPAPTLLRIGAGQLAPTVALLIVCVAVLLL